MGKAYKNFWSLNTDEAVVTGILRENTAKGVEVFMPINAQMKDIDLIIMNIDKKKVLTIQVKGSKAYEPKKNEVRKYGDGSSGWYFFSKDIIHRSDADYFIFLVYVIREEIDKGRRIIEPHTITIPTERLKKLCSKYKTSHGSNRYSFYFWVDPKKKRAFDWRDKHYDVSEYLDKKGFDKLNKNIK